MTTAADHLAAQVTGNDEVRSGVLSSLPFLLRHFPPFLVASSLVPPRRPHHSECSQDLLPCLPPLTDNGEAPQPRVGCGDGEMSSSIRRLIQIQNIFDLARRRPSRRRCKQDLHVQHAGACVLACRRRDPGQRGREACHTPSGHSQHSSEGEAESPQGRRDAFPAVGRFCPNPNCRIHQIRPGKDRLRTDRCLQNSDRLAGIRTCFHGNGQGVYTDEASIHRG